MTGADPAALPTFAPPVSPAPPASPRRAFVEQVMGLPVSVHVRGPLARRTPVEDAVSATFRELHADDAMFSTWKPDSEVSRIRAGSLTIADASPRVQEVAALCDEARRRTDGAFSAWLPDLEGRPVFDPTGLVKGWAVEQAVDRLVARLAALDEHDVLVSAGGDVVVHCGRTDTPDWMVGVEDPRDRSRILRRVPVRAGAVATSGTAARGAHLLDPQTGRPAGELLSATVVGPSLTWADVYATAVFVRPDRAGAWLRRLDAYAAVVVRPDGTTESIGSLGG